jgi:hypothetical protein
MMEDQETQITQPTPTTVTVTNTNHAAAAAAGLLREMIDWVGDHVRRTPKWVRRMIVGGAVSLGSWCMARLLICTLGGPCQFANYEDVQNNTTGD